MRDGRPAISAAAAAICLLNLAFRVAETAAKALLSLNTEIELIYVGTFANVAR